MGRCHDIGGIFWYNDRVCWQNTLLFAESVWLITDLVMLLSILKYSLPYNLSKHGFLIGLIVKRQCLRLEQHCGTNIEFVYIDWA